LICLESCSTHAAATVRFAVAWRPFGVDVRLTDLYPEMYLPADGYLTGQTLDASNVEHLRYAFELAGADCMAVITNTTHNTREACAIVSNLIALVEGQGVKFCRGVVQIDLGG
jgi:hypothetical protein